MTQKSFDCCSLLLLNEEQLQKIREARNKTRLPRSLTTMAIMAVAKHCTRYIEIPDSPLQHLRT